MRLRKVPVYSHKTLLTKLRKWSTNVLSGDVGFQAASELEETMETLTDLVNLKETWERISIMPKGDPARREMLTAYNSRWRLAWRRAKQLVERYHE